MAKEIKSKRIPLYQGGAKALLGPVYEIIRSFLKPAIKLQLSIESKPELYSVVTEEGQRYLSLRIQCKRKTLGNLEIVATGYFHSTKNKNQVIELSFASPPDVLEAEEEANLKCLTEMDWDDVVNERAKIVINIAYDYAFTSYLKTVQISSTWKFALEDSQLISNQLIKVS